MKHRVDFNPAILLKEIGFDTPTTAYYYQLRIMGEGKYTEGVASDNYNDNDHHLYEDNGIIGLYSAPTYKEVLNWLELYRNVKVSVEKLHDRYFINNLIIDNKFELTNDKLYDSFEMALEAGINRAIDYAERPIKIRTIDDEEHINHFGNREVLDKLKKIYDIDDFDEQGVFDESRICSDVFKEIKSEWLNREYLLDDDREMELLLDESVSSFICGYVIGRLKAAKKE